MYIFLFHILNYIYIFISFISWQVRTNSIYVQETVYILDGGMWLGYIRVPLCISAFPRELLRLNGMCFYRDSKIKDSNQILMYIQLGVLNDFVQLTAGSKSFRSFSKCCPSGRAGCSDKMRSYKKLAFSRDGHMWVKYMSETIR